VSKILAVAVREVRERWLLFPAALVIGFFPFVLPAFGVRREHVPTVGLVGAVLLAVTVAVVIGSSMLARDAANGRLGFLFSRPVSWPAIWGGKWLAALVLVTATGLLAAVPWMAGFPLASVGGHHGDSWSRAMLDGPASGFFFSLIVLAVGFANFNATAFRSRSAWVAIDLGLLLLAFWVIRHDVAPLVFSGLLGYGEWSFLPQLTPLAVGLLLASAAQVALGRTDIRRAHRAMSLAFWAVVALALAFAAGYLRWVLAAGPADMRGGYQVAAEPNGRWLSLAGTTNRRGLFYPVFLLDSATGRYVSLSRVRTMMPWTPAGFDFVFSGDGRLAARWRGAQDGRATVLETFDLTAPSPLMTVVPLESSPPPTWKTDVALSPSGALALLVHESGASLFAIPSGRRVATATLPAGWEAGTPPVVSERGARLWLLPTPRGGDPQRQRPGARVLDVATDGTTQLAAFEMTVATVAADRPWWPLLAPIADGRRLLTGDGGLHLRDGATGALVATLVEGRLTGLVTALADGRIVLVEPEATRAKLRSFDADGRLLKEVTLEATPHGLSDAREVSPGRVALGFGPAFGAGETLVVDVADGRIVDRLPGLKAAESRPWIGRLATDVEVRSGVVQSVHCFVDGEGRLWRIDFATGGRKVVAGPGAPRGERLGMP
jgi:hypothetical protein